MHGVSFTDRNLFQCFLHLPPALTVLSFQQTIILFWPLPIFDVINIKKEWTISFLPPKWSSDHETKNPSQKWPSQLKLFGGALIQGVWEALYKGIKGLFRYSQLEHQGIIWLQNLSIQFHISYIEATSSRGEKFDQVHHGIMSGANSKDITPNGSHISPYPCIPLNQSDSCPRYLPLNQSPLYKSLPVTVFRLPYPWGSFRWPLTSLTAWEVTGPLTWHIHFSASLLVIALTWKLVKGFLA